RVPSAPALPGPGGGRRDPHAGRFARGQRLGSSAMRLPLLISLVAAGVGCDKGAGSGGGTIDGGGGGIDGGGESDGAPAIDSGSDSDAGVACADLLPFEPSN